MNDENNMILSEKTTEKSKAINAKKNKATRNYVLSIFMIVCAIAIVLSAPYVLKIAISNAGTSAKNAYQEAKEEKSREIYDLFFKKGEKKYHVQNTAQIKVEKLKEISKLEVFSVTDVEYVIREDVWYEFKGEGIFTVNMKLSEVITDDERAMVIVRIPKPVLSNLNYDKPEKLHFEDNKLIGNGSFAEGEKIASEINSEGREKIETEIGTNTSYHEYAQNNAKITIESLVKSFNPDIEDLNVIVEFFD